MQELQTLQEIKVAVKNHQTFYVTGKYAKIIGGLKKFQKKHKSIIDLSTTNNIVAATAITSTVWIVAVCIMGALLSFAIVKNYSIDIEVDPKTGRTIAKLRPTTYPPVN